MVLVMKFKYVDSLSGNRKRFRRRYPKAVAEVLGESVFQVAMKARDGADLFTLGHRPASAGEAAEVGVVIFRAAVARDPRGIAAQPIVRKAHRA